MFGSGETRSSDGILDTGFSIEVDSKLHVKYVSISDEGSKGVLFEGTLGKLVGVLLIDDIVLEVRGVYGTLRVELEADELRKILSNRKLVP
jgi:hypothetical protein